TAPTTLFATIEEQATVEPPWRQVAPVVSIVRVNPWVSVTVIVEPEFDCTSPATWARWMITRFARRLPPLVVGALDSTVTTAPGLASLEVAAEPSANLYFVSEFRSYV